MRSYVPAAVLRLLLLPVALGACVVGPLRAAPAASRPEVMPRGKPRAASGLPRPQAYKAATAERALAEFLNGWHSRDFARMARFTFLTWRSKDPDPAKTLRKEFTPIPLVGASIGGAAHGQFLAVPTENIKNLSVTFRYRSDTGLHSKVVPVTVYRESRPFHQDVNGTWGVYPGFTLNLDD